MIIEGSKPFIVYPLNDVRYVVTTIVIEPFWVAGICRAQQAYSKQCEAAGKASSSRTGDRSVAIRPVNFRERMDGLATCAPSMALIVSVTLSENRHWLGLADFSCRDHAQLLAGYFDLPFLEEIHTKVVTVHPRQFASEKGQACR